MGSWQKPVGIGTVQERAEVGGRLLEMDQMYGYSGVLLECDLRPVSRCTGVLPDMCALVLRSISPIDRIRTISRTP
jgi:hypothetical protein